MIRLTLPAAVRLFLVAALALVTSRAQAGIVYNQISDFPGPFNALTSQSQGTGGSFQTYDNFTLSAGA